MLNGAQVLFVLAGFAVSVVLACVLLWIAMVVQDRRARRTGGWRRH